MQKADEFIKELEARARQHGIRAQHIVVEAAIARTTYDRIKYGQTDPTKALRKIQAAVDRLIERKTQVGE